MLTAAEVQSWSWRFIRVTIAVFIAVVCFGVALGPIERAADRYRVDWSADLTRRSLAADFAMLEKLPRSPFSKSEIVLNVASQDPVTGEATVFLPRNVITQIENAVANTGGRIEWQVIVGAYVPEISSLRMTDVSFTLEEKSTTGSIRVRLRGDAIDGDEPRMKFHVVPPWRADENQVNLRVLTRSVRILTTSHPAVKQSDDETVFMAKSTFDFIVLQPGLRQNVVDVAGSDRRVSEVVSSYQYVRVVQPLILAILYSIPFALLIVLLRRADVPAGLVKLPGIFIVLFVGLGILAAVLDLYFEPTASLRQLIIDPCVESLFNPRGAAALGAAFVVWLWPRYVRRAASEAAPARRGRIGLWIAMATVAPMAVGGAIAACTHTAVPALQDAAVALCLLAAIISIAAISAEATTVVRAFGAGVLTTFVAIVLQVIDVIFDPLSLFAYALVAVLLIPFVFTLLRMALPSWSGWTTLVAAFFIAVILVAGPIPSYSLWWQAELPSLVRRLSPALRLIAAVFLLVLLRRLSKSGHWAVLEHSERDAGIVLALTFFFLRSHEQWLAVAVSFGLGWLVLQKWMFVPRRIDSDSNADAPATIRDFIRMNEAALALRVMKRDLRAKIAKAELQYHEYERHVRGLEAFVDELRARLATSANGAPAALLSSGTAMLPWMRASRSATYGLLFGLPWMALFLGNFYSGFAPSRGADWVAALGSAVQTMGEWPLLGFFFGYFYPHLRGETGLSKGLYLFLAIAGPAFAATALVTPVSTSAWTAFALWALQMFIHCALLGFVAGDYETLRASGLSWQHLIDVHNLGALTAWGSTFVVAVAGAITTAAATKAGEGFFEAVKTAFGLFTK